MTLKEKILILAVCLLCFSNIFCVGLYTASQDKVEFYEEVMYDFGIDEFIHYPELFYDKGYVEQVVVHNCMWAIELDCEA